MTNTPEQQPNPKRGRDLSFYLTATKLLFAATGLVGAIGWYIGSGDANSFEGKINDYQVEHAHPHTHYLNSGPDSVTNNEQLKEAKIGESNDQTLADDFGDAGFVSFAGLVAAVVIDDTRRQRREHDSQAEV